MTIAHAAPAKRHPWRWVTLAIVTLPVVGVAWFAWDAWQLRTASEALKTHAAAAQQAVSNRDAEALAGEVQGLEDAAATFAGATDGPHWWLASYVPWLKDQTVPLQVAGDAVEVLANDALAPISEQGSLAALEVPAIQDSRIDPYILEPYREVLGQAARAVAEQEAALQSVDLTGTVTAVRTPFVELRADLETVGAIIQGGHVAAEVLPTMLGAEGERTYLVMVQNNAEPRATGGIPGAILKVHVVDGRMDLVQYATAGSMQSHEGIDVPLTEDEESIFTGRMRTYPQDVNFTPEYPRSAQLMAGFWRDSHGEDVDGVLSVDPVALGYMLAGMEPTEVQGVTITGENLSTVMLRDSYLTFPEPADQDAFFAEVSSVMFDQLMDGGTSAVAGTEQAIDERRFLVWSAHEDEQQLLASTPVAGAFIEETDTLGLFVNDGSGSKIGYYIDASAHIVNEMCTDGTLRGQTVTMTFTHTFDGDVGDLPEYVAGGWLFPAGEFHANVLLYPAVGTAVTSFTQDGEPAQLSPKTHHERRMSTARIVLAPGQTHQIQYAVVANEHGLLPPQLAWTPGPQPNVYTATVDNSGVDC